MSNLNEDANNASMSNGSQKINNESYIERLEEEYFVFADETDVSANSKMKLIPPTAFNIFKSLSFANNEGGSMGLPSSYILIITP